MATKAMIEDALRYIGIRQNDQDEAMSMKVEEGFYKIGQWVQPRYVYQTFGIEKKEQAFHLKNTACCIKSKDMVQLLRDCESCIVLAATLGVKADREIGMRQHMDMLEALIIDACCSVLIDKICDDVEEVVMASLEETQSLTMRFSPGYGDLPLEASRDILTLLNAEKRIGLSLTDSYMLVPTKSITALIGISSKKENKQKNCGRCNMVKSCSYRRRGERCGL